MLCFLFFSQAQIKELELRQKKNQEDIACLLQDNKDLTERLLKVKEEIAEKERKTKYYGMKKVVMLSVDHSYSFYIHICCRHIFNNMPIIYMSKIDL